MVITTGDHIRAKVTDRRVDQEIWAPFLRALVEAELLPVSVIGHIFKLEFIARANAHALASHS